MKDIIKIFLAFLCSILIAGTPFGSMAADKIPAPPFNLGITSGTVPPDPVTPPGNDGMLSGMTPGNYKIPSGWSLVRAQDFEETCPASEWCGRWSGKVTSTKPHSGSKSVEGAYSNDQADAGWSLSEGHVGSFSEIYLSWWEYLDSTALFNDEFMVAKFGVTTSTYQEVLIDWLWAPGFNKPSATLYAVPQGNKTARYAGKTASVPKGTWVQWEIHYRPNTSGNSNGFIRIYKDGSLYTSAEKADLNGTVSMNNTMVMIGGHYTKLVWMMDSPTCTVCSTAPGNGTDYCTASKGWSGQSFSAPKCAPTDPPLPSFKRYFDDIILMKK